MNDIDKMPVKCRDCPYWEIATYPWCCGDCKDIMNPKNGEYIKRIDAKKALTALPADLDAETVQRCIEAMNSPKATDVEPVVRCENCQFFENVEYWPDGTKKVCQLLKRQVQENSFCCWGMKKEAADV